MSAPLDEGIAAKVRASFARQTLMATLGAEIVGLEPGHCTIAAPILATSRQQHGHGHAGLSFAIGDSAAGYAALSLLPAEAEVLTIEMKINLLAPAAGKRLVAEGRVVRAGRRIVVVQAEVWAEAADARRQVALLQGTMIPT